jgi:hypothetical protein
MRQPAQLTADEARDKAAECLEVAQRARDTRHRIMLEQMAAMWEQIARETTD